MVSTVGPGVEAGSRRRVQHARPGRPAPPPRSSTVTSPAGAGQPQRRRQAAEPGPDHDDAVGRPDDRPHAVSAGQAVRTVAAVASSCSASRRARVDRRGRQRGQRLLGAATRSSARPRPAPRWRRSTSRSASHPVLVQAAGRRAAGRSARPAAGAAGSSGQRDQHGPLALAQVVAGRLAGLGRVAEDAEHVVAQLERLAERQPVRRSTPASSSAPAPASAAPSSSGLLDGVLRRLVPDHLQGALDRAAAACACSSMSRYCPPISSVRISSNTGRARASRPRSQARCRRTARRSRPGTGRRAGSRRPSPKPSAVAAPAVPPVQRGRTGGARRAGRGGCRCRPSRRRGSARQAWNSSSAAAAVDDLAAPSGAAGAAPAPVAERRAQPLAAAQQVARSRSISGARSGADRVEPCVLAGEEVVERLLRPACAGPRRRAAAVPARDPAPVQSRSCVEVTRSRPGRAAVAVLGSSGTSAGSACRDRRARRSAACRDAGRRDGDRARAARGGRTVVLLRVLPAQDRRGRAQLWQAHPPARAAAADLRLGDVRRRRLDPRPDRAPSPSGSPPTRR